VVTCRELITNDKERDERGRTGYYRTWRTYHMSGHLPMRIELVTDLGEEYLKIKSKR